MLKRFKNFEQLQQPSHVSKEANISSREPPQFHRQNVSPPSQNRLISSQNDEACFHHFVKLSYNFAIIRLLCVLVDEEPRPTAN